MNTPKIYPITLEQIDKTLEEWQNRMRFAMDNLLALDDSLTYKRLEGKDGLPQTRLTGLTSARVTPALAAMRDLFQYINRLSDVVERAANMRKALPRFFPSDNALRDIDALLNGPSVRLPSVQTPLAQRSLMSAAETPQTITPSRLLEVMTQAFDQARSAITAVDEAWAHLEPALGDCETQATELQRLAGELGEMDAPDLTALRQKLDGLRVRVESDPLGVEADFDRDVRPLLARVRARLLEAKHQHDQMQNELGRARALLAQLQTLHQQCQDALTECRREIADPNGLKAPLKPEWLTELATWLDTLETALRQGRWKAARVGLDRWLQTASQYIEAERAACSANRAPVELRAELKGRLSALKAKAQARGQSQDTELSALAYEAEALLRERPTPTVRAAQIVSEYEARVAHKK